MNKKNTTLKKKPPRSSYDEYVQNLSPKGLRSFKKGYQELLLSELILAAMHEDDVSVRELAKAAGISPTIVQEVRAGKRKNLTLQSFCKMLDALGYSLVLEKSDSTKQEPERIIFHPQIIAPR